MTIFGSADQKPRRRMLSLTKRQLLVLALLVILAGAAVAAGIWWWQKSQIKPPENPTVAAYVEPKKVCTDAQIDAASQAARLWSA